MAQRGRAVSRRAPCLLAEALHVALCYRRKALARQRTGFGSIDDVFEWTRDEHLPNSRAPRRHPRHLVQDGKATVDLVAGDSVQLDGSSQVLAEAGVEVVIVVPDLETRFGKEVGEILFQIVIDALKGGSGIASGGPARMSA